MTTDIFVFGSNLAGIHGAGAANYALQYHGAKWGQGYGLQGNSFGIPTKDVNLRTLPLAQIMFYVEQFLIFANNNPHLKFKVTRVGCGLAGYTDNDIAPMFRCAPANVDFFEPSWRTL